MSVACRDSPPQLAAPSSACCAGFGRGAIGLPRCRRSRTRGPPGSATQQSRLWAARGRPDHRSATHSPERRRSGVPAATQPLPRCLWRGARPVAGRLTLPPLGAADLRGCEGARLRIGRSRGGCCLPAALADRAWAGRVAHPDEASSGLGLTPPALLGCSVPRAGVGGVDNVAPDRFSDHVSASPVEQAWERGEARPGHRAPVHSRGEPVDAMAASAAASHRASATQNRPRR